MTSLRFVYIIAIIALMGCLMYGNETARYAAAVLLGIGAAPWWKVLTREALVRAYHEAATTLEALRHGASVPQPPDQAHQGSPVRSRRDRSA